MMTAQDETVFRSLCVPDIHICKTKSFNALLNYFSNILFFCFEKDFLLINW